MTGLLHNPQFLYAVAFFIFAVLAFKYGRGPLFDWLDAGIAEIRTELEKARQLRAEAEAMLESCKKRKAEADADAQAIIARAKQQVVHMREQARADLAAAIARDEQLVEQRIRMAEIDALAQVRAAAVDAAMTVARATLEKNISPDVAATLVDRAIAAVGAAKSSIKPRAA